MCNWQPIHSAPFGQDLQLSVIEDEVHSLAFPCRQTAGGWMNRSGKKVDINPSHWRDWREAEQPCNGGVSLGCGT